MERSAQCRSSIVSSSPSSPASSSSSSSRPSNSRACAVASSSARASERPRPGRICASAARAGADSAPNASWPERANGRSAVTIGAYGSSPSPSSTQSPPITRIPSARATRSSSATSRVLPSPDSPAMNASPGRFSTASVSPARSSASSGARPTNVVLVTREATTTPVSRAGLTAGEGDTRASWTRLSAAVHRADGAHMRLARALHAVGEPLTVAPHGSSVRLLAFPDRRRRGRP